MRIVTRNGQFRAEDLTFVKNSRPSVKGVSPGAPDQVGAEKDEFSQAVDYLLDDLEVPAERRPFADVLVRASGGRVDVFECADARLGRLAFPEMAGDPAVQWRRAVAWGPKQRRKLRRWQTTSAITVVEIVQSGYYDQTGCHPTKYRLIINALAWQAIEQARRLDYYADPAQSEYALRDATAQVAQDYLVRCGAVAPPIEPVQAFLFA